MGDTMKLFQLPLDSIPKNVLNKLLPSPHSAGMVDGLAVKKDGVYAPAVCIKAMYDSLVQLKQQQLADILMTNEYQDAWNVYDEREDVVKMSYASDTDYVPPSPAGKTYFGYQKAGIQYAGHENGVIFGDAPGLGKTIQIAGVLNVRQHAKVVIVCPVVVKPHWRKVLAEWLVYPVKHITEVDSSTPDFFFKENGIFIFSYAIAAKLEPKIKKLDCLVLDESHYVRTFKSERRGACSKLATKATQVILATGTPIENRPKDLYHQLKLVAKNLFNNSTHFYMKYCGPKFNPRKNGYDYPGASNTDELAHLLRSTVMVRRKKEDVLKDLPSKIRQRIPVTPDNAASKCALPLQYEDAIRRSSDVDETLRKLNEDKSYSSLRRSQSVAKVPACIEFIEGLVDQLGKVVVFYHHKVVGDALAKKFKHHTRIDGSITGEERTKSINDFVMKPHIEVILISIMAGGTGLDGLQQVCSTAVFVEFPENSSTLVQAEDRLHRIGQQQSVMIYHMLLQNSLDYIVMDRITEKQADADAILE